MRDVSAFIVVTGWLGGCGQSGGAPCRGAVALPVVQSQVFDGCATTRAGGGCHSTAPFGAKMDLSRGMAYSSLLHSPSNSSPGKFRVEPGDLESSFLWQKLKGELAGDGREGVAMPRDASDHWAPLSDGQLAAVRCWINQGAAD